VLHVADLARHYGITDLDGSQPERFEPFTRKDALRKDTLT
jgi:hypothetical protein